MSNVASHVSRADIEDALRKLRTPPISVAPELGEILHITAELIAQYASDDANLNEVSQYYYLALSERYFDNTYFDKVVKFAIDVLVMEAHQDQQPIDRARLKRLCNRIVLLTTARFSENKPGLIKYLTRKEEDDIYLDREELDELERRLDRFQENLSNRQRPSERDYYRDDRDDRRRREEPLINRNMGSIFSHAVAAPTPRHAEAETVQNSRVSRHDVIRQETKPVQQPVSTQQIKTQPENKTMIQAIRDTPNLPAWVYNLFPVVFDASKQVAIYEQTAQEPVVTVYNFEEAPAVDYKAHETEYLLRSRNHHFTVPDIDNIRKQKQYKEDIAALSGKLNATLFEGALSDDVGFDIVRMWTPVERLPGDPHVTAIAELNNQNAVFDFNTTCLAMNIVTYNPECYTEPDAVQALLGLADATSFIDLRNRVLEFKAYQEPHGFGTLNRDLTNHVNELLKVYQTDSYEIGSFVDDIEELINTLSMSKTKEDKALLSYLNEVGLEAIKNATLMTDGNDAPDNSFCRFACLESWVFVPLPSSAINLSSPADVAYVLSGSTPELYKMLEDIRALATPTIRRMRLITLDGDVLYCVRARTENSYALSMSEQL